MALPLPYATPRSSPQKGVTQAGVEIFIYSWCELEPLSLRSGKSIRTYCPLHGSDRQRSLAINRENGWGQCFSCQRRVLVRDWNPQLATALLRRAEGTRYRQSFPFPERPEQAQPALRSLPLRHVPIDTQQSWQEEERQLLTALQATGKLRVDRPEAWNAQAYLTSRHIPLDLAMEAHVGYLEPGASERSHQKLLARWEDRILFPLQSAQSAPHGYAGRLLWHWQACEDELVHKRYLETQEKKRWIKTNPAGWFWSPPEERIDDPLVVVEGPFDRLAILAAGGFQPSEVVALVGTALQPTWLQGTARALLLALDADQSGQDASARMAQQLAFHHVLVERCVLPARSGGKDWSERWRRHGDAGMEALYSEHAILMQRL